MSGPIKVLTEVDISYVSSTRCVIAWADHGTFDYPAAILTWDRDEKTVEMLYTKEDYRRQGIATMLWNYANELDGPLRHGYERSADGQAWAESVGGERVDWPEGDKFQKGHWSYIASFEVKAMASRLIAWVSANTFVLDESYELLRYAQRTPVQPGILEVEVDG